MRIWRTQSIDVRVKHVHQSRLKGHELTAARVLGIGVRGDVYASGQHSVHGHLMKDLVTFTHA